MFRALTSVLLCTVCWFGPTQDPQPQYTEVDLRIKSVGLGTSHALVLRHLGRPAASKRERILDPEEVCGPSYTLLVLRYEGAVIELNGDLNGRNFEVVSIEVTSPKFLIAPGIKIGMTEEQARSKIDGPPAEVRTDSGSRILIYVTKENLGGASLYFRKGRLVKVGWGYTMC